MRSSRWFTGVVGACAAVIAAAEASAVVSVSVQFDAGVVNNSSVPVAGSVTTGEQMAGMIVSIEFVGGGVQAAVWASTGFEAGAASGTGWVLRTVGDTFFSDWTFENNTGVPIRSVSIDGAPGLTMFDTTFNGEFGTDGTGRGKTFVLKSAPDNTSLLVTYRDLIGIQGAAPVGDVYRRLEVVFQNEGGLESGGRFIFGADSDNVEFGGDIGPGAECCEPWDNGDFDRQNAQTSQIGFGQDWKQFGRITADDFWLCEGNIYHIRSISGKLCTDSIVPKARVLVFEDCDGTPGRLVAEADSVQSPVSQDSILGWECRIGTVQIAETGELTDNGFRIINVTASFDRFWLKGGHYWVAIVGYSGTADPDEQFFWGTSGNGVVKGRPGKFYDSADWSWTDIDEICCGCTDFNFCLLGDECKILLDNGSLDPVFNRVVMGGPPASTIPEFAYGSPSLQNGGRTADKVRTADNFVVPPCTEARLCYVEAWILTNCDRVRLDIYRNDCHLPAEGSPVLSAESECLTAYGVYPVEGRLMTLYKAEFYSWSDAVLAPGNYWLSVYALGDGRQNARGYFVHSHYCDRPCQINFDPGAIKGPPFDTQPWRTVSPARDFAFVVGIAPARRHPPDVGSTPVCAADVNNDGTVTLQDVFDFLTSFFQGCP